MDFSLSLGPILVTRQYVGPCIVRGGYRSPLEQQALKPRVERQYGEADHGLIFWARHFWRRPKIYWLTNDQDLLANGLAYVTRSHDLAGAEEKDHRIVWVRPDQRQGAKRMSFPFFQVRHCQCSNDENMHCFGHDEQIDFQRLGRGVLAREYQNRWPDLQIPSARFAVCNLLQFLCFAAFMGTDYVFKEEVAPRISEDEVRKACLTFTAPEMHHVNVAWLRQFKDEQLFPVGECDAHYCIEVTNGGLRSCVKDTLGGIFKETGVHNLIVQYAETAVTLPAAMLVKLANGGNVPNPEILKSVIWQLHYWLVNLSTVPVPRQDPAERYVSFEIEHTRGSGSEKRKLDGFSEEEGQAQKKQRVV
jgi:hypothetical protein